MADTPDPFVDDLRAALDPVFWAESVAGIALDPWQRRVISSRHQWVALLCSRQAGKTTCAALKAAHLALYRASSLVLIVTPSMRQTVNVFDAVERFVVAADRGSNRLEDNKTSLKLANGSRIVCVPASPDTIRGFSGVHLLIEDEAAFVDDAIHEAVRPMIAVSGGQMMIMSTPAGQRGHFYEAWSNARFDWDRYKVTAAECPRIDPKFVERERQEKGDWYARQEYGCEFVSAEDSVFSADQVRAAIADLPAFGF